MSDWPARIDALLAEKPDYDDYDYHDGMRDYIEVDGTWLYKRLALAAERLKEPHEWDCDVYVILNDSEGQPEHGKCTCGKDSDLLRILEGK